MQEFKKHDHVANISLLFQVTKQEDHLVEMNIPRKSKKRSGSISRENSVPPDGEPVAKRRVAKKSTGAPQDSAMAAKKRAADEMEESESDDGADVNEFNLGK